MNPSNLDAAREVERLQKLYGNIVINASQIPVRSRKWAWYATLSAFAIAALLLTLGFRGLRYVDRTDRFSAAAKRGSKDNQSRLKAELQRLTAEYGVAQADVSRAGISLEIATERFDDATAAQKPAKVIRRLELDKNAAAAEEESRVAEREARATAKAQKKEELAQAQEDAKNFKDKTFLNSVFASTPSAQTLVIKAVRLGSHVFAVIGVLCFIGGFCVAFVPWVRQRAAALLEDLVKGVIAPSAMVSTGGALAPISFFSTPTRQFFGGGEASLMGRIALQATAASAAVAVTVGAFSLAIPGRSIDAAVDKRNSAIASIDVGAFDIKIPGKQFQISPDRVILRNGDARVDVPELALQLPPIQVPADQSFAQFANELRTYREHLERVQAVNHENASLRSLNAALIERYGTLVAELQVRPTKSEFDMLRQRVDQQITASSNLTTAIGNLESVTEKHRTGSYLSALELARTINSQNDRLFNTLFRQTLIEQNCATYEWLHQKFPDMIAPDGCIKRRRFDPIVNPGWHAPPPFRAVPIVEKTPSRLEIPPVATADGSAKR